MYKLVAAKNRNINKSVFFGGPNIEKKKKKLRDFKSGFRPTFKSIYILYIIAGCYLMFVDQQAFQVIFGLKKTSFFLDSVCLVVCTAM